MRKLITIAQAEDAVRRHTRELPAEIVTLSSAHGRLLREPIKADRAIPPYDRVMMDGIAIDYGSFVSGRRDFAIAGTQAAGQPPLTLENADTCIEVMTGAVLPRGTDCVVKIEDIRLENGVAHLSPTCPAQQGQHIHPLASDREKGSALVSAGSIVTPPVAAIAASVGMTRLSVSRIPRILLVTTGDEVVPPGETPQPHQIRRSHCPAIRASIEPRQLGLIENLHVPDTSEALERAVSHGLENADLVLLTGGISMGKYDYVAPVMQSLAGDPVFHGVAQRPGKPFAFWPGQTPVFALPGNPVSVMACLARYILPALRKTRGESWEPETFPLAQDTPWNAPFPGLVASRISNHQLHPAPPQNSGDYTALASATGICELASTSPAGTHVPFYPW